MTDRGTQTSLRPECAGQGDHIYASGGKVCLRCGAITDMAVARDSHEEWARYLRAHPSPDPQEVKIAGDSDYHVAWVGKYDLVLTILRARRNALRSRSRRV